MTTAARRRQSKRAGPASRQKLPRKTSPWVTGSFPRVGDPKVQVWNHNPDAGILFIPEGLSFDWNRGEWDTGAPVVVAMDPAADPRDGGMIADLLDKPHDEKTVIKGKALRVTRLDAEGKPIGAEEVLFPDSPVEVTFETGIVPEESLRVMLGLDPEPDPEPVGSKTWRELYEANPPGYAGF